MIDWLMTQRNGSKSFKLAVKSGSHSLVILWLDHRPGNSSSQTPLLFRLAGELDTQEVFKGFMSSLDDHSEIYGIRDAKGRSLLDVATGVDMRSLLEQHQATSDTIQAEMPSQEAVSTEDPETQEITQPSRAPQEDASSVPAPCRCKEIDQICFVINNLHCDNCRSKIDDDFYYDCCTTACYRYGAWVCRECYAEGRPPGCPRTGEHKLRVRYVYDNLRSYEELSPWVAKMELPLVS
ncbi:hypothetical protein BZA05DRAFT_80304 [Tricharina praecox]|uniref:uncharacterized protein n=1 Tax=Tricharina praecox TaxID=43433 RepID=UPI00221FC018|nr:uncharacterized protein BZA05DRAFT_80304 [Tricharina praecox]KAI5848999.1 hypothetical protein BZA05DRAFT_80304 [Tricharina praecox]